MFFQGCEHRHSLLEEGLRFEITAYDASHSVRVGVEAAVESSNIIEVKGCNLFLGRGHTPAAHYIAHQAVDFGGHLSCRVGFHNSGQIGRLTVMFEGLGAQFLEILIIQTWRGHFPMDQIQEQTQL